MRLFATVICIAAMALLIVSIGRTVCGYGNLSDLLAALALGGVIGSLNPITRKK